jgi:hypothetical protein
MPLAHRDALNSIQQIKTRVQGGNHVQTVEVMPALETPIDYQSLPVTAAAVATLPTVANAVYCDVYVDSGEVRVREDGTNPSASIGQPLLEGFVLRVKPGTKFYGVVASTLSLVFY